MADLSDKDASLTVKITGADSSGSETNFIDATVNGIKVDGSAVTQPISGSVTANAGTNLNTSSLALETTQSTQNTRIGDIVETAPVTDTASSGLNGRLQRVAQRLSAIYTALSDGSSKTQIVSGLNTVLVTNTAPSSSAYGLVTRSAPFELATFSVVAETIQIGNNKSMVSIVNTGTSQVRLREAWLINDRTAAVTGVAGDFRMLRITGHSGGTIITPVTYDTNDTLPSGITAQTGATTITGETDLLRLATWSTDEWGPGTLDQEGLDHGFQNTFPFWKQTEYGKPIVIRQNQGIHIKFTTNSTAGYFNIRLVFTTE